MIKRCMWQNDHLEVSYGVRVLIRLHLDTNMSIIGTHYMKHWVLIFTLFVAFYSLTNLNCTRKMIQECCWGFDCSRIETFYKQLKIFLESFLCYFSSKHMYKTFWILYTLEGSKIYLPTKYSKNLDLSSGRILLNSHNWNSDELFIRQLCTYSSSENCNRVLDMTVISIIFLAADYIASILFVGASVLLSTKHTLSQRLCFYETNAKNYILFYSLTHFIVIYGGRNLFP